MALDAKKDYPQINFEKSIVVGDSISDMEFGRNAGMFTVYVSDEEKKDNRIDFCYPSLSEFVSALQNRA